MKPFASSVLYVFSIVLAVGVVFNYSLLTEVQSDEVGAIDCNISQNQNDPCIPVLTADLNLCKVMTYKTAIRLEGQSATQRWDYEKTSDGYYITTCVKRRTVTYSDGTTGTEDVCQPQFKIKQTAPCTTRTGG